MEEIICFFQKWQTLVGARVGGIAGLFSCNKGGSAEEYRVLNKGA
jgi:hypothetical protein